MSAESYVDTPINGPLLDDGPSANISQLPSALPSGRISPLDETAAEVVVPASHELIVVSCYTRFDNLAHGPRGTEAKRSLYTFRLDENHGELVLYAVSSDNSVMNPAFSRFDPRRNLLYTCTESVAEPGDIVTYSVDPRTGKLFKIGSRSAGGTSICYLTLDQGCKNMLVVNYWDATIGVFGLEPSGALGEAKSFHDPNEGRGMQVSHKKHVNHSENDPSAQKERQSDPHSHAVILDPFFGKIAYVPDLGMDLIRQFRFDPESGTLECAGTCRSGPDGRTALGPRYIEFHPTLPVAYVVNELSSEVSVFAFDKENAERLLCQQDVSTAAPTLRLVQTVRTIPEAWPNDMNTCGRISVHSSGHFVLVSNRGHNSITVFRVHSEHDNQGMLSLVQMQHTRGATPRHFQFDSSGQWLISANQDSDKVSVFRFNVATGNLEWTGHEYNVPSPNFVCCMRPQMTLPTQRRPSSTTGDATVQATTMLSRL